MALRGRCSGSCANRVAPQGASSDSLERAVVPRPVQLVATLVGVDLAESLRPLAFVLGGAIHILLSIVYGAMFGLATRRLRGAWLVPLGVAYGAAIYTVNFELAERLGWFDVLLARTNDGVELLVPSCSDSRSDSCSTAQAIPASPCVRAFRSQSALCPGRPRRSGCVRRAACRCRLSRRSGCGRLRGRRRD